MNRQDLQDEFRKTTGHSTVKLNKCEVGTNPEYVVWLENTLIKKNNRQALCSDCFGAGWNLHTYGNTECNRCDGSGIDPI